MVWVIAIFYMSSPVSWYGTGFKLAGEDGNLNTAGLHVQL